MSGGLDGRVAVVTGVSRRRGIGYAIACRLACAGASVFLQHYSPHDAAQPWGADDIDAVMDSIRTHLVGPARLIDIPAHLPPPRSQWSKDQSRPDRYLK